MGANKMSVVRLSLKVKLSLAFLIIASLVGLIGYLNISTMARIQGSFDDIIEKDTPRLQILEEIRFISVEAKSHVFELQTSALESSASKTVQEHLRSDIRDITHRIERYLELSAGDGDEDRQELELLARELSVARSGFEREIETFLAAEERAGVPTPQVDQGKRVADAQAALTELTETAITDEGVRIKAEGAAADRQVQQMRQNSIIISLLSAVLALLLGAGVAIGIGRNIRRLQTGAAHMASGDFSHQIQIKSRDELGQLATSFNQMSGRLKDSYQRMALEKQRAEALLESMSEGLIAVDESGQIVMVNSVAARLLQLQSRADIFGKSFFKAVQLFDKDTGKTPLTQEQLPVYTTLQSGNMTMAVLALHHADAKKTLVNVSSSPISLEGKTVGAIILMRDVTKEKEIDRMKTEFISLASHQLRTPLSAIRWFTEMLLSGDAGKMSQEQEEFAKNIYDSTQRMIDLVNSLLNISRIESGRIIVDPKPTDLTVLVNGVVNDLQAKIEQKHQTLIVSVHKDLPKINLDPHLIGQVFMNFLTNAIKYTPSGGEISVFVSRKDDELVSQITDNGYGIPASQQDRLFQKFFRAENIVKVETDGTGLGLYLVKAIIESSGGKVWFKSEEGKGTSFWFSLPMSGMKAKEGEVTLDA
jgi:two-component system, OmpR family, phosphate regulon sensor histidine kinase PhoR